MTPMLTLVAQSTWRRRRRLTGTATAVGLGVAFLVGTIVLGDTFAANFDRLFASTAAGTDVVVRSAVTVSDEPDATRGFIDASVLDAIVAVDGVALAVPDITGYGQLLGVDGEPIGGDGPPRVAGTWIAEPELNPYRLVEGRAPTADDEVIVNRGAAKAGGLRVGDRTIVQTPRPVTVTVTGIATFGDADGLGETTFTAFTPEGAAQHVVGAPGRISDVLVAAVDGVQPDELCARIAAVLPAGVDAITGDDLVEERLDALGFLVIIRVVLVGFAAVALLVAAVSITNTFTITVAQRTQELALLRAVGATRRQLRRLVRAEALAVGLVGAALGTVLGLALAAALKAMFAAFGSALPDGGLTVRPRALAIGMLVGTLVTVFSASGAARRAGRLAPVAALRSVHVDDPRGRARTVLGAALVIGGVVLALARTGVAPAAFGTAALVAGSLLVAPALLGLLLRPVRHLTARSARATLPLAIDNVARSPRRNAGSATALLIGVTVVAMFTVFAASGATAIDEQADTGFGAADLAIATPAFGGGVLSPELLEDLRDVGAVDEVLGVGAAPVVLDGRRSVVSAADLARLGPVLGLDVVAGAVDGAGSGAPSIVVDASTLAARGWTLGATVRVGFADGATTDAVIGAVVADAGLLRGVILPDALWRDHQPQAGYTSVFVTLRPGADAGAARLALDAFADRYSGTVQDRAEYGESRGRGLEMLLGIVYVMLALAIVIALVGIANTLALSIHERRRELGVLRAVGQTRRQVRRTMRIESVVIATFGTLAGCVVGSVAGAALFRAAFDGGRVTVPASRLGAILVAGVVAGTIAAWRPARRAARLPVLEAIGGPA